MPHRGAQLDLWLLSADLALAYDENVRSSLLALITERCGCRSLFAVLALLLRRISCFWPFHVHLDQPFHPLSRSSYIRSLQTSPIQRPTADTSSLIESIPLHNTPTRISQSLHRPVVTPPSKLLLHRLAEHRSVYITVRRRFRCELFVKVRRVSLV